MTTPVEVEPIRQALETLALFIEHGDHEDGFNPDCESCVALAALAALTEDAREMSWLLRRCLAEADLTNATELLGLLTAWTVAHKDEYPPPDSEASA